ncbi:hypothetical protein K3495_g327 [Podosphaera aphanis]|nr:hypothetical protein K3495_g327 [Podosphaera aphanis]
MFGGVASAIDEAARGANSPVLPPHLRGIYEDFLFRLHAVTQSFFESHVWGSTVTAQNRRPPTQSTQQNTLAVRQTIPTHSIPPVTRPNLHAVAAASGKETAAPRKPAQARRAPRLNPSPVDERLFLCLGQDATERLLSPYPLLLHYCQFLGENAALLKEVQHVPSGLDFRSSSEAAGPRLEALFSDGIMEGKLKGAIGIEKAQNLVTYLISFVPRSFTALDEN